MDKVEFSEQFKSRTKALTIEIIKFCETLQNSESSRIIKRQLLRSASSVGANYRAACRARSKAEFFSKMSTVVEEADESLFWLEILKEAGIYKFDSEHHSKIYNEMTEVLKVMSKTRKNTKR